MRRSWPKETERRGSVHEQKAKEEAEKQLRTDDKRLFGLRPVLVVPGWSAGRVDGALARAEQRWLRFAQRRGALPAKGPSGGQEPVQRVLPAPAVKHTQQGRSAPEHADLLCLRSARKLSHE